MSVLGASPELLKHRRQPAEKVSQRVSTGLLWEEKRALILTRRKIPAPTGAPLHIAGIISVAGRPVILQQTETGATELTQTKMPMNVSARALEWLFGNESAHHVIQDVVYRTTEGSGWGVTVRGYEVDSLKGRH